MAIFWNHIKGTGNATSNTNGLWTWIKWSAPPDSYLDAYLATLTDELSPEIKVNIGNDNPNDITTTLGKIVTTEANNTIKGHWTWQANQITLADHFTFLLPSTSDLEEDEAKTLTIKEQGSTNDYFFQLRHWDNSECQFDINGDIVNTGDVTLGQGKFLTATGHITTTSYIHTDDKCEARYFNATSDKRAKDNITPATFSGLDLINKLSLYTFNYKNTTGTVPGILAQDLLEVQPEGLDLVDNIAATGENGDYMSIKADKLIFVLMQAIKEQQAQIDELKAELKKLTK